MKFIDMSPVPSTVAGMTQVLVVEDEYIIAANLQENLESLGYRVADIATEATEAIEKASILRPDIVLMDIRLRGGTDGVKAAEQIWNRLQIPVIFITGHSDRTTLERAKSTFPFGYLLKPIKDRELYVAIETALNRYEREQLLATVFRSIGDGIIVVNTRGRVMFLNRSAELLTGWLQEEARDQELPAVFNVMTAATRLPIGNLALAAIQQDQIIFLGEQFLLTTKDGTIFPVTDSIAPVKNHKGLITGAVIVFRDDTQRQRQADYNRTTERAQLLERQTAELQALNELKDDFLSTVSHELRTPLTNIRMAIQMLEITLDQQSDLDATGTDRMTRYLNILRDQCNQELSLVNNLLELQQIEAGLHPIEHVEVRLDEWIANSLEIFQERAHSRGQQLQMLIASDLPVLVTDLTILTRVFAELLMNACKYTPPGGEITVSACAQPNEVIQLVVCNTGVTIAAADLPRIFDKFYRVPKGDRYQQGGTGLGLALIKQLVGLLGGSIWAESDIDHTCFTVELPLVPPQAPA